MGKLSAIGGKSAVKKSKLKAPLTEEAQVKLKEQREARALQKRGVDFNAAGSGATITTAGEASPRAINSSSQSFLQGEPARDEEGFTGFPTAPDFVLPAGGGDAMPTPITDILTHASDGEFLDLLSGIAVHPSQVGENSGVHPSQSEVVRDVHPSQRVSDGEDRGAFFAAVVNAHVTNPDILGGYDPDEE